MFTYDLSCHFPRLSATAVPLGLLVGLAGSPASAGASAVDFSKDVLDCSPAAIHFVPSTTNERTRGRPDPQVGRDPLTGETPAGPFILPPALNPSGSAARAADSRSKHADTTGGAAIGGTGGVNNIPNVGPTPPAAWSGFATLVLLAAVRLRRKLVRAFT